MIGIMAAMDEELNRIVDMLDDVDTQKVACKHVYTGLLNQKKVVVVFSGWGKVAAASTATMLIERYKISQLIMTGVAGAIAPHLNIGDVVVGKTYVQHDMDCAGILDIKRFEIPLLSLTEIPSDQQLEQCAVASAQQYLSNDLNTDVDAKELRQLQINNPTVYNGLIASGDQFINSSQKQNELRDALPGLLAVEMEGAAVAQVAHEYGIAFIVIRIISDKADSDSMIDFPRFIEQVASHFTAGIIRRLL